MTKQIKILLFFIIGVLSIALSFSFVTAQECNTVTSVRASHILVDTQEKAFIIKNQIDKGASFEEMAKKYSKCPSGKTGGDLGYFGRGEMVPSFEKAAFSLPIGVVSEPIETNFGWHLIKVYDKQ